MKGRGQVDSPLRPIPDDYGMSVFLFLPSDLKVGMIPSSYYLKRHHLFSLFLFRSMVAYPFISRNASFGRIHKFLEFTPAILHLWSLSLLFGKVPHLAALPPSLPLCGRNRVETMLSIFGFLFLEVPFHPSDLVATILLFSSLDRLWRILNPAHSIFIP